MARRLWRWSTWKLLLVAVVFGGAEFTYFAANVSKVAHGGWLPLTVALCVFTVMATWQRGRELVTERRTAQEGPLDDFVTHVRQTRLPRVRGTAVFPHSTKE